MPGRPDERWIDIVVGVIVVGWCVGLALLIAGDQGVAEFVIHTVITVGALGLPHRLRMRSRDASVR